MRLVAWVGDHPKDMSVKLISDADFAGDLQTPCLTSGVFLQLAGANTCYPLAGQSKKQSCVSHSTPEAELVAADLAIRTEGLPALQLWDKALGREAHLDFEEDNQAAIRIMESGKSNNIRHLARTHRVDLAWLHEQVVYGAAVLRYCDSNKMAADIFTKAFSSAEKWGDVCKLIGPCTLR